MRIGAVDTSVIVAALLGWHESHEAALRALATTRDAHGSKLLVPAPALVEAYSVLTRLPAPHRLAPAVALELLAGSFEESADVISLTGGETWRLLADLPTDGVTGGRTYDALILRCARKGRATSLLTLNRRDFEQLPLDGIVLVVPGTND